MEELSNKYIVNKILYHQKIKGVDPIMNSQQAYLIHTSVLVNFVKSIYKDCGADIKYDLRPYTLQVGEASFDMALVFITVRSMKIIKIMEYHVKNCQYTKTWEFDVYKRKTLYIELDRYHILEKFIKMHNLEKSIIDTVVEPGINTNQNHIKIVTFSQEVNYISLVYMFGNFLTSKLLETDNRHYYINNAFDWLQPTRLNQLNKLFENERFFFGLQTFLDYLRGDLLNILDLCAMKLAFCELTLKTNSSAMLAARIDELITNLLKKAEIDGYIQDGEFDLHDYAEKHNLKLYNVISCDYFLYTFQNHFPSIKLNSAIFEKESVLRIVKLINPQDLLLELRENPNISYAIETQHFPGMNAKIFSSILQCGNVNVLMINAKVQWLNSTDPFVSDARKSSTLIILLDPDQLFMETFIKSLNSMSNTENLQLHLKKPNLQSFSILKNLTVATICFLEMTLTSSVLAELMECNFYRKALIMFQNIKIINDVQTWLLFISFKFVSAKIIEEEKTWQHLFDAIVLHINQLRNGAEFATDFQFGKFKFQKICGIQTNNNEFIDLAFLKFTMDESKTKLEIRNKLSNRQIDLFDLKNELNFPSEEENDSCYEFYQ